MSVECDVWPDCHLTMVGKRGKLPLLSFRYAIGPNVLLYFKESIIIGSYYNKFIK